MAAWFRNPAKTAKLRIQDRWRNGSAFASRAKGYPFKSGVVQNLIIQPMILTWEFTVLPVFAAPVTCLWAGG